MTDRFRTLAVTPDGELAVQKDVGAEADVVNPASVSEVV
jgi:hypothetical protein